MDEVIKYTRLLSEALKESEAYLAFRSASRKLEERPELKSQIDAFRKRNYILQNSKNSEELFEEMIVFEKEYEEFRKDPLANAYLNAELEICRTIQRCSMEIMTAVDLEIENFTDVIQS